jgi:sec-independent protein translocase protein TatC
MSKSKTKRDPLDTTMSLGDHLEELRMRLLLALAGLVVCTLISLGFTRYIILFLERPYVDVMGQEKLQVLALTEGFVSYVKIALITALVISSPWVFYHVWMFVAAGLYPHERRYVNIAAPFSAALFIAGAVFFILIVAPISIGFLVKVNQWLGLRSDITFKNYITFVTTLMLVFGIAFQTPSAIFFLNRTGLVPIEAFAKSRKYVILVIFIVAAMATPPDVVSQITLAIPLYALFELGILLCYLAGRKKRAD